jgi:hypothetical protein
LQKVWIITYLYFGFQINFFNNYKEIEIVKTNEDAKRLLDDLFSDYNPIVRPVSSPSDKIILSIGLKLSQIADIVIILKLFLKLIF